MPAAEETAGAKHIQNIAEDIAGGIGLDKDVRSGNSGGIRKFRRDCVHVIPPQINALHQGNKTSDTAERREIISATFERQNIDTDGSASACDVDSSTPSTEKDTDSCCGWISKKEKENV
jgi:hypothetical protein